MNIERKKIKKEYLFASAMTVALALAFGLGIFAFRGAIWTRSSAPVVVPVPAPALAYRHPLTGEALETEEALPQVYAVMIDHSVDARPDSGTDDAFLVIEAPVEAGIPRLEAFFYEGQEVLKIGPVRSARPYFVDWANEFDAMYAHVGGSPEALELIATNGTFDMNEYSHSNIFWRSTDRYAPHNAYTSTELLGKALATVREKQRAPDLLYGVWKFKDPAPSSALGIDPTIEFSSPSYRVFWEYDEQLGKYRRIQGGKVYDSKEGDAVWADNVVVVVTTVKILDSVGRREIKTVGEGKAVVFQDGNAIEVTWKKASVSERLRFFDADKKEITMNAGKTWIEVIPDADDLTYPKPIEATDVTF